MRTLRILFLAGLAVAVAWSQTLVEYGLGVAAAGTAGGAGSGSGIAGIFSNLTKTLSSTADQAGTAASSVPAKPVNARAKAKAADTQPAIAEIAQPPAPAKPAVVYEDPSGIRTGMEKTELLSRFGQPVMKVTTGSDGESLTYDAKDRIVEVEIRAGKVYSAQTKSKPRQASVVLLQ